MLVAGGNKNAALDGIVQTHFFNWQTETWSKGPDMAAARWYPAVQALGNNEAVIVGGGPAVPEVYQTDKTLRKLSNASGYSDRLYAFLTTRPNGQVELMGPVTQMNTINTSGAGAIAATKTRDGINRTYGGFATYDIGKVLVAGGGDITEGGQPHVPTKTAYIVDVNGTSTTSPNTTVTQTSSMSVGRRQHSLTILADGSVLATGGMRRQPTRTSTSITRYSPRSDGIQRRGIGRFCPAPAGSGNTTPAPPCCPTAECSPAAEESAPPASARDTWKRTSSISSRPICTKRTTAGKRPAGQ